MKTNLRCLKPHRPYTVDFAIDARERVNLFPFFDICSDSRLLAVLSPRVFGCVLLYLGHCSVATVAVCGFRSWSLVFHCGLPRQISPLPQNPSQTAVCSTMGERIRPSSFHNPTLSANKHLAIGGRADCSGERRTSPFNGVERSLSRALVIKTKSLPISATTFATALSLYIAHGGRKHKHNTTLSVNIK